MRKIGYILIILLLFSCSREIELKNPSKKDDLQSENSPPTYWQEIGVVTPFECFNPEMDIQKFYIFVVRQTDDTKELIKFFENIKIDIWIDDVQVDTDSYLYNCLADGPCTGAFVECLCIKQTENMTGKERLKVTLTRIGEQYAILSEGSNIKRYTSYINYFKDIQLYSVKVAYKDIDHKNVISLLFNYNVYIHNWDRTEIYLKYGRIIEIDDKKNTTIEVNNYIGAYLKFYYYGEEIDHREIERIRFVGSVSKSDPEGKPVGDIIENPELEITKDNWYIYEAYTSLDAGLRYVYKWSKCVDEIEK
jgi:hypothetical protein